MSLNRRDHSMRAPRLTGSGAPSIVRGIPPEMNVLANFDIDELERRIDALLHLCRRLREENASLKARQEALVTERGELIEKNEQARSRVEAMLSRLRAMEESL